MPKFGTFRVLEKKHIILKNAENGVFLPPQDKENTRRNIPFEGVPQGEAIRMETCARGEEGFRSQDADEKRASLPYLSTSFISNNPVGKEC